MLAPCKGCQERHRNCHSTCEKYAEFQLENERLKANIAKAKDKNRFMYDVKQSVRNKAKASKVFISKKK